MDEIKKKLEDILNFLCIPLNLKGYLLIRDAVLIKYFKPEIRICNIYKILAVKHNSTYSKNERAMRYICNKYYENIQNYFNFYGKITTSTLISFLVREVKDHV